MSKKDLHRLLDIARLKKEAYQLLSDNINKLYFDATMERNWIELQKVDMLNIMIKKCDQKIEKLCDYINTVCGEDY